jgi:uncharacterized membrane protein
LSVDSRQYAKRRIKEDRESERDLVRAHLEKQSLVQAIEEVKVYERERHAEEKKRMILAVPEAEKQRRNNAIYGIVLLIISIVAGVVVFQMLKSTVILVCAIAVGVLFSSYLFRQAYLLGIVSEKIVPQEEIDEAVRLRQQAVS